LIKQLLGWATAEPLVKGLETTYRWIEAQVRRNSVQGAFA
jgi:hypothetical protein